MAVSLRTERHLHGFDLDCNVYLTVEICVLSIFLQVQAAVRHASEDGPSAPQIKQHDFDDPSCIVQVVEQ